MIILGPPSRSLPIIRHSSMQDCFLYRTKTAAVYEMTVWNIANLGIGGSYQSQSWIFSKPKKSLSQFLHCWQNSKIRGWVYILSWFSIFVLINVVFKMFCNSGDRSSMLFLCQKPKRCCTKKWSHVYKVSSRMYLLGGKNCIIS